MLPAANHQSRPHALELHLPCYAEDHGTSHISIVDSSHMAVSMTTTGAHLVYVACTCHASSYIASLPSLLVLRTPSLLLLAVVATAGAAAAASASTSAGEAAAVASAVGAAAGAAGAGAAAARSRRCMRAAVAAIVAVVAEFVQPPLHQHCRRCRRRCSSVSSHWSCLSRCAVNTGFGSKVLSPTTGVWCLGYSVSLPHASTLEICLGAPGQASMLTTTFGCLVFAALQVCC